jgi:hypothetical protein
MRFVVSFVAWLYLTDIGFDVVRGWVEAGDRSAECGKKAEKLIDPSQEVRERAAREFEACSERGRFSVSVSSYSVPDYLQRSIEMGNLAAQTVMLLSRFAKISEVMDEHYANGQRMLRWTPESQPVRERVVAVVAKMARFKKTKPELLLIAAKPDLAEAEFLLDVLSYIKDDDVLKLIAKFLDDKRQLPNRPQRLCDYAVPKLEKRLGLKLSFYSNRDTYTDSELEETRRLVAAGLSKRW